jgi:hypothetical protein
MDEGHLGPFLSLSIHPPAAKNWIHYCNVWTNDLYVWYH